MNKFRAPDDGSFRLVSSSLKEIADNSPTSKASREERSECLKGLASRYQEDKNRIKKRVPNTCMWVLEHPKYLHWRQDSTASLLWISADPGCGKSVLSRPLVDEGLLESSTEAVSICYFFFKDDDLSRQDGAKAMCAILHQLAVQKPTLLEYVLRRFRFYKDHLFNMFSLLWDSLERAAADPQAGEIICVLDGLDECGKEAREELIQQLSRFYSSPNKSQTRLKFLATSRPYVDVERAFHSEIEDVASINLRGDEELEKISREIDLVICVRVPQICRARRTPISPEVQQALISCLKNFEHRTYLWLYLILDVIQKSLESTKFRLERLINTLPRSAADAYEKMLGRIDEEHVQEARCLMHLVVAAVKPLTLSEMNVALAISDNLEYGEPCQSRDDLELQSEEAFREKIRTLCGLFVTIVDSRIFLIHQTAKEFLVSTEVNDTRPSFAQPASEIWKNSFAPVESNLVILKICLSYILLRCRISPSVPSWVRRRGNHPYNDIPARIHCQDRFQVYAAENWEDHFLSAKTRIDESVLQSTVAVCEPRCSWLWSHWKNNTSLMIGSRMRLETVVEFLLEKKSVELNVQDTDGHTALHLAAKSGYHEIVKMLVEGDGIELNHRDKWGRTALHWAAERERGYPEVVKELVGKNGVEVNLKDVNGQTPLHLAATFGRAEVVKVLMKNEGLELDAKDYGGQTPLLNAIMNGKFRNEILRNGHLRYGDLRRGQSGSNRFKGGHLEVIRLLLSKAPDKTIKQCIDGSFP